MQAYMASIEPMSTKNWPGKVSLIIYFSGCDFRCPYCFSAERIEFKEEYLTFLKDIKKQIDDNSELVDSVVFSGGEPCMQRQALIEIASYAKKLKLDVGLETDGSKPDVIKSLIDKKLVDFVAIDLKAPLEDELFEKVTKSKTFFVPTKDIMQQIKRTIEVISEHESELNIEFRTIIVPGLMYRKEDVLKIAQLIKGIESVYVLRPFSPHGNLLNKNLMSINPPSRTFLENLREVICKEFPAMKVEVRE